jgi:predicted transcriptional regulator
MSDIVNRFEDKMVEKAKKEHTRLELTLIWCIKYLNELVDAGIATGKPYTVTDRGEKVLEGFEPTEDEIKIALAVLRKDGVLNTGE